MRHRWGSLSAFTVLAGWVGVGILSGCATTFQSQIDHALEMSDEAAIAADMVAVLSRGYSPRTTAVYLYPANSHDSTAVFDQAFREAGFAMAPDAHTDRALTVRLLGGSTQGDSQGYYCFVLSDGNVCREYLPSGQPAGPVSASLSHVQLIGHAPASPFVVAESVIWFANDAGRLGPKGKRKTQKLVADFLSSGADYVVVTGISNGSSRIGNAVLAEKRAQSVAALFFDAGVASTDIQLQTVAQSATSEDLPGRAAIVRFMRRRHAL